MIALNKKHTIALIFLILSLFTSCERLVHTKYELEVVFDNQIETLVNATKYWTTVVHQEAFNSLKDMKNTYGQKGDDNWEYIALAEGWACYRQKLMCSKHINYNHKIPTYSLLITNYSNMYFQLKNIGISDKQLEKSLSVSNSINNFKINLLNQVNNTKQQNLIKEKFKTYE